MAPLATAIKHEDHVLALGTSLDEKFGIKVEGPSSSPGPDVYEETDECELEHSGQSVWLVKLPQFIQGRWEDITSSQEEEIDLGTIMINRNDPSILKIVLSDVQDINEGLPRVYDLKHASKLGVDNTFVFTEKSAEKKRKRSDEQDEFPEIPVRLLRQKDRDEVTKTSNLGQVKEEKPLRCRKTDLNPTAVVGTVITEMQMQPVPNAEYNEFERKIHIAAKRQSRERTNLSYELLKNNMLNPGTTGSVVNKHFLKITPTNNSHAKVNKAYRASKESIQTKLFGLFEKYEYYPIKVLVGKLCQPEAYLREVLEGIGTYNTSGEFSGKWCLKSEYKKQIVKGQV